MSALKKLGRDRRYRWNLGAPGSGRGWPLLDERLIVERRTEEATGEAQKLGTLLIRAGRSRGADDGELTRLQPHVLAESTKQRCDLGTENSGEEVNLVHHEVRRRPMGEELPVASPKQQELELQVVRDEDVGRRLAHRLARPEEVVGSVARPRRTPRVARVPLRCVTGVAAEGHARVAQQTGQTLELVVGQGVHRIDEDRADACAGVAKTRIDDGDQKRLGLAGAGTGQHER